MSTTQKKYIQIKEEIGTIRKAIKRTWMIYALLQYLFNTSLLLIVILIINSLFEFSALIRTLLIVVGALIAVTMAGVLLLPRILNGLFRSDDPTDNDIALRLGNQWGPPADRLANALQLFAKRERLLLQYTDTLIDDAMEKAATAWKKPQIDALDHRDKVIRVARRLIILASLMTLTFAISPTIWREGWIRTFYPHALLAEENIAQFTIKPGNITLPKGEPVLIKAIDHSAKSNRLFLHMVRAGEEKKLEMVQGQSDTFYFQISAVKESFHYFVANKKSKSSLYRVDVLEFPSIRSLQIKLVPPMYAHQDTIRLEPNIGDIEALKGTMVIWNAETNKPLKKAMLAFGSDKRIALAINGLQLKGAFAIFTNDVYTYEMEDNEGLQSSDPITYHVKVITDHYPFVRILSPNRDVDLDDSMVLPLLIQAQDDYGIAQIQIAYQVLANPEAVIDSSKFQWISLPIPHVHEDQIQIAFRWDLSTSQLLPNEVLVYHVIVYDNDTISGPKKAQTDFYRARFPTIYELYQEISKAQEDALAHYEQAYQKSQEIQKNMETLSLQLKRIKELSWQKRQEIEENVRQQEDLQKMLDQANQQLDEMLKKSDQHKLLSPETLQKFRELQQLYQDIMTPELQAALEKIKEAMQNIDENLIQKAIENFKDSEKAVVSNIERTIALLKRLKQQQAIEQAIRMTEDIHDGQQKISEQLKNQPSDIDKSLKDQEALAQNAKELGTLIEDLAQEAAKDSILRSQELLEAAESMKNARLPQRMRQNMSEIQRNSCLAAEQISQEIQSNLKQVSAKLQKARDALSGAAQKRALQAIRAGMNNLLALSYMQEELLEETKNVPPTSAKMQSLAEGQKNLLSGLERVTDGLYEASKETFAIKSNIATSLGQAQRHMQSALQGFESRDAATTTTGQGQAMAKMNEAVKQLFSSLQSMMAGGKGGGMGMDEFIQQLQSLAASQQGINSGTSQLGQGDQFSLAQQAAISRLAQQQGQVRKTLEELIKEAGEATSLLGDMEKIVEDMKDVEKDLWNGNIKRETIEKQNQILSRMLDAQKSIREREYSNRRKAETGKEYLVSSPAELPKNKGERRNRLQQDLLRAKKEGYTRDYLEVIRRYFEAVTEHETN